MDFFKKWLKSGESQEHPNPASLHTRRNSVNARPSFRLVLVGHDWMDTNEVFNFLLGRDVVEIENPSSSAKNYNTGFTGYVLDRCITMVSTTDLFTPNMSDHIIKQKVKECVSFCAPGPHALVLVMNPEVFDEGMEKKLEKIVTSFSEGAFQHSIVFTYEEHSQNKPLQKTITGCGGRIFQYSKDDQAGALNAIENMISENSRSYISCDGTIEMSTNGQNNGDCNVVSSDMVSSKRLNLVLCGSSAAAKASAADMILGEQTEPSPQPSSACVKRGEVGGHDITLILMPALEKMQLSEEKVLLELLQSIHLCDPGVHAFLFVHANRLLTDEDKRERRRLKLFFGEEAEQYHLTVLTPESEQSAEADEGAVAQDADEILQKFILDHSSKVSALMKKIERMREEKPGYTSDMYINAQLKNYMRCHSQLEDMKTENQALKMENDKLKDFNQGDLRIILLGKTGSGKSATGNTILGGTVFKEVLSHKSVTTECQKETGVIRRRQITVIDTPGLFDTSRDNEETKKEIMRCVAMAAPGPHVFLLVITLGRFTQEEENTFQMIQEIFGEEAEKYMLVLFTRGDDLQDTLEEYLKGTDSSINSLLKYCGHRYHVFNNRDKSNRNQVHKLLDKMDDLTSTNGGKYYNDDIFQEAEEFLCLEQERILKEKEVEINREKDELQAKYEAKMEKLRSEMEEERRRLDEEKRKREEEFKFKEEEMKKAFDAQQREEMEAELNKLKQLFEEQKRKATESCEKREHDMKRQREQYEQERQHLMRETEVAARKQAEKEFHEELDRKVKEVKMQAHVEGYREGHKQGKKEGLREGVRKFFSKKKRCHKDYD